MRKLLLLPILLLLSCETDSVELTPNGCECERVVYEHGLLGMNGVVPIWGYEYQYSTLEPAFDCGDESDQYEYMGENLYYKVECE